MATFSPMRYPGGKAKVYDNLLTLFEKNQIEMPTYIEPFAGGAGLALKLLMKGKVNKIIINDYDRSIYAIWYSILNHTDEFCSLIENAVITPGERVIQKEIQYRKMAVDLLTLGFSTFFLNRTNVSGIIKGGVIGGKNQTGNYKIDCRFNKENLVKRIKRVAEFKDQINLYNFDASFFMNKVVRKIKEECFIFLDPPYYAKGPELYENHYTHDDHINLSKNIMKFKDFNWIITYDNTDPIKEIYQNYRINDFDITYSANKKMKAKEVIIYSPKIKVTKFLKKSTSNSPKNTDSVVYVSKSGKKYHRKKCVHLKSVGGSYPLKEAEALGYEACSKY